MPPWFSDFEDPLNEIFPYPISSEDQVESREDSVEDEEDLLEHPEQDQERSFSPAQQATPATSRSGPISRTSTRCCLSDATSLVGTQHPRQKLEVSIPKSTLITPRGRYHGWIPPAPRARQHAALASLMEHLKLQAEPASEEDFIEFELDKFSVYVDSTLYPCELRPLQQLSTKGPDEFFFDGVLGIGDVKFYVERVAFSELPIGNYGTSHASVDDQIWIRSRHNAKKEIYYKLKNPATEYDRFHTPFLWIADLAKHVVDFCGYMTKKNKVVTLRHFQQNFLDYLQRTHKTSPSFRKWHKLHGSDDFRAAINANVEFIWKEVYGVLGHRSASSLQVFNEIKHLTQYRPFTSILGDKRNPVQPCTIVTPYIYKCFGHSEFGALLECLEPQEDGEHRNENEPDFRTAEELEKAEVAIVEELVASDTRRVRTTARKDLPSTAAHKKLIRSIKAGDTISTPPDGVGTGTKWKKEVAKGAKDEQRWFGLIQRVHVSPKTGARSFDVTWLYRPVDTPCCKMVYPWSKELCLSDHCTCEEGRDARVDEDEVIAAHDVDWFGSPETTTAEFFVRQTYQVEQRRWVTLEQKHMVCDHDKLERTVYRPGDTVLAAMSSKHDRADIYEVVKVFKQGSNRFARLRRLRRRDELEVHPPGTKFPPNELVYTDQTVVMKPQRILGRCVVRFFEANEPLPCPYDRNGTANVFFITHKLENGTCVPISDHNRPTTMRQGFDPKRHVKKLRGLDLFCGSGNFGRGLEEGGVVDMCWTNDIWTEAIHTYMVNASHHTKPFLGSVDDLLRRAIEGDQGVPRRGDVDFISGGSPCQGFSLITGDKTNDRQKKNRSLVASFASFIDFYRPKYGILENVLNIVQTGQGREEDAFSQLICAIVGMGYQTQLALGDAWTYGAPQSRSRAFLYFAAPGHRLPDPPRPSHSHFEGVKGRGLGIMTNGESFVSRSFEPTPFKFVTAAGATADIPDIQDAKPDYCIGYPDHRISRGVTIKSRFQFNRIPIQPYGMNFAKAWNEGSGTMTPAERELFPPSGLRVQPGSHGWGRVLPNSVFSTITTGVTPTDARTGRFLHWRESRPITILEARRAQGFLDHEVLVGSPVSQYELVGNSVARPMALALGLQFREAWLGSLYEERGPVLAGETVDASLSELHMGDIKNEDVQEQEVEMEWDDDGDSLFVGDSRDHAEDIANGTDTMATPATSVSEAEAEIMPSGASRKRPFSESLAIEMHASKVRKLDTPHVVVGPDNQHATAMGPMENSNVVVSSSISIVVEREQVNLAPADGAIRGLTNGNLAVRSAIDLTVTGLESGVAVVQSAADMVIDLTDD
ncbi:hypothetical protein CONLIGDRAFT_620319 [Coniochaeta ligniaria NRRL 30616]|uniref:DNA (cytosine-5-)-methyltransferase n=1 Tax=Coniochaeta ligniaria NRRL 30616 TaxID=1408157 RepID=A0A1J7J9M0_9PEZI|nr:hypothetical protein CONLIGDRAFT_620319 [Coniochaeta ligniaria NRRL 30616]